MVQRRGDAGLPEHHLLRPGCLRHRRGVQGLLQQTRRAADRRRRRATGGTHPAAVDAGSGGGSRGQRGQVELGTGRHGNDGCAVADRPCGGGGFAPPIAPKAQAAAEKAVSHNLDGQNPDMRSAAVSIDPHTGAVKAYYGGSDANGFDFAQAGLPTGSSFKVFALVAALQQGIGLGYQVDSSPVTVNGITITNVEGEGCGTCSIAEALKRSLNTAYYRLMLKLKNGPRDVADAAHKAGVADHFPGVDHTLSEDGKGGPPNNGIVLGQYQTRVLDMASAYATLAASGVYHAPYFVQKVVNAEGQVLFDASTADNSGTQRIDKAVADNVTDAMRPIAGWSNGHNLAGGRASEAKTGTGRPGGRR